MRSDDPHRNRLITSTDKHVRHQQRAGPGRAELSKLAGVRSFMSEQDVATRIIGGQEAWAHSWPWQVSLRFATMPACGGAIVSSLWVVSAAHCFKRYNKASFWTVLAGKHDLDSPQETGQQLVGVAAIVKHHGYNTRTKDHDMALLKLQRPLLFNQFVRPINIWMNPLPLHQQCTVTGWGATHENGPRVTRLQEVNVTLLSPDDCRRFYAGRIKSSMFCAGKNGGGADACQGDSGGPLSCFHGDGNYELAGLVSWGIGCGRARKPGVYTNIQNHTRWIADIMSNPNITDVDNMAAAEQQCGKQRRSSCQQAPGLAGLSVVQNGEVSLSNISESCPFFWPWQVSLQTSGHHYCSGVLIHRHWVLAARHCGVRAKEDVVVLGVHDIRFSPSQTVLVDEVVNPPQDNSFPPTSDLSLLRLSVPARFSATVSPVCLPDEDEELDNTWSCVTAGWGVVAASDVNPNRLHHAQLELVNHSSCQQKWGQDLISDSHMCAHSAGAASCMGDSGAPLFCQKHGTYFLFGMLSWGSGHCNAVKPSIFTRVSDYHPWITEVTDDV
ncbi:ovochymase-1 [Aulostomus maculatus]